MSNKNKNKGKVEQSAAAETASNLEKAKNSPDKAQTPESKPQDPLKQHFKNEKQAKTDFFKLFSENPLLWGIFCFKEYFRVATPFFHDEIMQAVMKYDKLAIAAPRGHAKSVLLVFVYPLFCLMFKRKHCIVIVSNTERQASRHLRAMKEELKNNKTLRFFFGKLKFTKDTETEAIFTHSDGFSTLIVCKGVEQVGSIRGTRHGAYRVDLVIGDDMEDDEMVRSRERRDKLKEELDDVFSYAGDLTTQFVFVGTILHDDSQLSKLISDDLYTDYHKMFYKAHDTINDEALWEEWVPLSFIKKKMIEDPRSYAKELQNNPIAGTNTRFTKDMFRYWKESASGTFQLLLPDGTPDRIFSFKDCRPAISCDLAWSEKREADQAVILAALLTPDSDIIVYKYYAERGLRPDRFNNIVFPLWEHLYNLTGTKPPLGLEKAALERVTQWLLKQEMRSRGTFITTKELSWDRDKISRIEVQLEARYANNTIYHKSGTMGDLEHELLRFPSGKHDDICLLEGTMIATPKGDKPIETLTTNDTVITPFGIRKITSAGYTGYAEIMKLNNMYLTPNHKVYSSKKPCFVSANMVESVNELSTFNCKEIIQWKYRKLLHSKVNNTVSWAGRESIISASQAPLKDGKILKDFMWQCGNFITSKQYLKGFVYITKMVTLLITTYLTLSAYHIGNILKPLKETIRKYVPISTLSGILRMIGTGLQKVVSGIVRKPLTNTNLVLSSNVSAQYVIQNSSHTTLPQNTVHKDVETDKNILKGHVYNLTVAEDNVFYANGNLVSNCDALQGACQLLKTAPTRKTPQAESDDPMFDRLRQHVIKTRQPWKAPRSSFQFGKRTSLRIPSKRSILD